MTLPQPPPPPQPQGKATSEARTQQFSKTKMCKFEILGMCAKGPECPFAHSREELKQQPDLRCTKLCLAVLKTGTCNNKDCGFAHSKDELRRTSVYHKTKLCRFIQSGQLCSLGLKCGFAHCAEELAAPQRLPQKKRQLTKKEAADRGKKALELPLGLASLLDDDISTSSGSSSDGRDLSHRGPLRGTFPTAAPPGLVMGASYLAEEPAYIHLPMPGFCSTKASIGQTSLVSPMSDLSRGLHMSRTSESFPLEQLLPPQRM